MLNLRMQSQENRLRPKITVVGVGGAGGNAVNNMVRSGLEGCEFLVCNTDAQALDSAEAPNRIQLGVNVTRGLGAGANPEIGGAAAEESIDEILGYLQGSNMVFITAGMGGGTGTGAAPVIAKAARDHGILTVGVVTKPFHFEGAHRMRLAEAGIAEMQKYVDTLIVIPNQNLFRIANEKTSFSDAFALADEVLQSGVRGVTDLMVVPGIINLDFADIRAVMAEMGKAMMGTGEASGERRAIEAAEAAISNPLLDDVSMKGARGVLINITGGSDLTLFEVDEATNRIRDEVDPDANIIFGTSLDERLEGTMRISVVATGIDIVEAKQGRPVQGYGLENAAQQQAGGSYRRPAPTAPQRVASAPAQFAANTGSSHGVRNAEFDFDASAIPASIMPSTTGASGFHAHASAAVDELPADTSPVMEKGFASGLTQQSVNMMQATARKIDVSDIEVPRTPMGQGGISVTRKETVTAPSAAGANMRGQRHGNTFIPPKPMDPWAVGGVQEESYDDMHVAEDILEEKPAQKPMKKAPSLFERFTGQRKSAEPEVRVERASETRLSVETGKAGEVEDELDIPAFLRRQAN